MPFCAVSALVSALNSRSASGNGSGRFRLSYGLLCVAPSSTNDTPNDKPPASEYAWPPLLPPMLRLVGVQRGLRHRRRQKLHQVGRVASVERQVQDALVVHHLADAEIAGFDRERVGLDRDGFLDLPHRHGDVDDWRRRRPAARCRSARTTLKPCSVASRRYGPTGRFGSRNCPSASVTALRLRPVSVCVTVTSTPGSTPPLPSFTVPLI